MNDVKRWLNQLGLNFEFVNKWGRNFCTPLTLFTDSEDSEEEEIQQLKPIAIDDIRERFLAKLTAFDSDDDEDENDDNFDDDFDTNIEGLKEELRGMMISKSRMDTT